jgi:hypothetical protein
VTNQWYVKRYWEYGGREVSTVLGICDTEAEAQEKLTELRERYQSDQYVVEPYDPKKAALWPTN